MPFELSHSLALALTLTHSLTPILYCNHISAPYNLTSKLPATHCPQPTARPRGSTTPVLQYTRPTPPSRPACPHSGATRRTMIPKMVQYTVMESLAQQQHHPAIQRQTNGARCFLVPPIAKASFRLTIQLCVSVYLYASLANNVRSPPTISGASDFSDTSPSSSP